MIITLAGAVILDLIVGEPPIAIHPVAWMGKFITFLKTGASIWNICRGLFIIRPSPVYPYRNKERK
jgi:cobalamin biosynthesis protein CobD/CbiB